MRSRTQVFATLAVSLLLGATTALAEPAAPMTSDPAATDPDASVTVQPEENLYARPHFYIGIGGVGSVVLNQGSKSFLSNGGGIDLTVGVRVHSVFAVELNWQPTFHNNTNIDGSVFARPIGQLGLEALTTDLKFYPADGPVQPYFTIGGGIYFLGERFDIFADGPGYEVGGGIDFWLSPWISLGVKAQYRGVELIDFDSHNNNTYLSMFTAGGDLTARF